MKCFGGVAINVAGIEPFCVMRYDAIKAWGVVIALVVERVDASLSVEEFFGVKFSLLRGRLFDFGNGFSHEKSRSFQILGVLRATGWRM